MKYRHEREWQNAWLEEHHDADEVVCSTKTGEVLEVRYHSPISKLAEDWRPAFWGRMRVVMADESLECAP